MAGSMDLMNMFRDWEYDEENNVRFITGDDGREVMQIRQPMGIEQYDLDGRPDGFRPDGADDFLELYLKNEAESALTGEANFRLKDTDFRRLQTEGILYYQRYLALFQVGQYDRVARDTRHNLQICDLLERRYSGTDRFEILQYRPYIIRINAIAGAMLKLAEDEPVEALKELNDGKTLVEALDEVPTPIFEFEKIRTLQHLAGVIRQVEEDMEPDETNADSDGPEFRGFRERLAEELKGAVESEDYERAARLRDRLKGLD